MIFFLARNFRQSLSCSPFDDFDWDLRGCVWRCAFSLGDGGEAGGTGREYSQQQKTLATRTEPAAIIENSFPALAASEKDDHPGPDAQGFFRKTKINATRKNCCADRGDSPFCVFSLLLLNLLRSSRFFSVRLLQNEQNNKFLARFSLMEPAIERKGEDTTENERHRQTNWQTGIISQKENTEQLAYVIWL